MEIYCQQQAYALYQGQAYALYQGRTCQCIYVPYSVNVECLDVSGYFAGKHFSDIADAIYAIEHQLGRI